jgi:hypothetical protein
MPRSIVWILLCGVVVSAGGRAGAAPVVSCPGDIDGDEMVTINELITAVNSALTGCVYDPAIDPADFVAAVTNPYFPLEPGTTFHYESQSEEIAVTVTHETKTIIGVACTVVHDVVMEDGEITEDTFDWYAQDAPATSGTSARTRRRSRTASPTRRDRGRPASTAPNPASPSRASRASATNTARSSIAASPRIAAKCSA